MWALPLWFLAVAFLILGRGQLRRRRPRDDDPGIGGEKQLFTALRDAGGNITPIEAALETSLTVDEAEEILSRLAGRGHILLESRDGVLFYAPRRGRCSHNF